MFEFLKNTLYVMEAVAAVTTFIYIKKWRHTYWKWFPFYLAFIVIAEYIGNYFDRKNMAVASFDFYSYFVIPIEFSFFFWIFLQAFKTSPKRRLPQVIAAIYFVSLIADAVYFRHYIMFYLSLSYTIGNILLLILILNFFLDLMNSNNVLKFRQNILFWVSVGLLMYYLGSCPYYGLRNILVYQHRSLNIYYGYFVDILDSLMYLTFALGFICGKPN